MRYGNLPKDCGLVDIRPTEMMFWLYCPIALPGGPLVLPDNLRQFRPIIDRVRLDLQELWGNFYEGMADRYMYLTAKTLWVAGSYVGNRPGWHSDGFGTDDLNYIWYDRAATHFLESDFTLPDDCTDSMRIMERHALGRPFATFPNRHLLRLDPSVVHRPPVGFEPGMRSFVKVSISKDRYNLQGNSVNHAIGADWDLLPRAAERNHPAKAA